MGERLAALKAREVFEKHFDLSVDLAREAAAGVLREEDFRVTPEWAFRGKRLDRGDIEHSTAEVAGIEERHERVLVERGAAADVADHGVALQAGETGVIEKPDRRACAGAC